MENSSKEIKTTNISIKYDNKTLSIIEYNNEQIQNELKKEIKIETYNSEEWTDKNFD
jgi:hypothetical protein